ncbi:hypothetical protein CR155_04035 [Pollutimonas nitritireducens]|uniref:Uncharacterized protein n=1 Tax=Pollutimonas nitritireducens TaxID=2045209 RepID=A0A2N4UK20_9BURK|nr:hypothetical protein [Pollutimonas nitritireducens]PLC55377.1 hypothetical protein CR155_04035 [Pollutimonas nitritireducens]
MGYGTESNGRSADSFLYGHVEADPRYASYRDGELSSVWEESERLRILLRDEGRPKGADRVFLETALERQLPTLRLYQQATLLKGQNAQKVSLYVIVFPGEAKDNTGIKDLNDKILRYHLNNLFIKCRQDAITKLFTKSGPPPKFATVGLDYKTAQIIGIGKTRRDFADTLIKLDEELAKCLLALLPQAEDEAKKDGDKERLKAIADLKEKLQKKGYRFDFLFGVRTLNFAIKNPLEATFLILTEALKAAGMARFMAKADGANTRAGRRMAAGVLKPDAARDDRRGKEYDHGGFIKVIKKAGDINDLIREKAEYLHIWIDKVWTVVLYEYRRRVFVMNPDVIRDARKKAIKIPTRKAGLKSKGTVKTQIDLIEIWLVAVNALDLVKDFLVSEFRKKGSGGVEDYHAKALAALDEVSNEVSSIKWDRLGQVLTRDFRQGSRVLPVQGRASEFGFYAHSSDYTAQILFSMDIRDLGVQIALLYDWFIGEIEVQRYEGVALMEETFASSDLINQRKRVTYDKVVDTFRKYFPLTTGGDAFDAARKAFHGRGADLDRPQLFESSVTVMLGGDEIFVSAHPVYSMFVCTIIDEIRQATYGGQPLNLRTGVAYSRAEKQHNPKDQKKVNWVSHDQALGLATASLNPIKGLERAHRRMERLIEKLAANDKKKALVPAYTAKLEALGLMSLFARSNYRFPYVMPTRDFRDIIRRLTEWYDWSEPYTELVNLKCETVDGKKLWKEAEKLEAEITKDVGWDNYYVDPPPTPSMPPLVKKLMDWLLPAEKYPYEESKEDKREREIEEDRKRREGRRPRTA